MHWVYIINCENNIIYVGETKNLYSRLHQHTNNKGSKHTIENKPQSLSGLYKVQGHYRLLLYNREIEKENPDLNKMKELLESFDETVWINKDWALALENFLTEYLLHNNLHVYGGKYVNDNKFTLSRHYDVEELKKVPLCNCGLPAEIRCVKNNKYYKLYFTCCIKNVWSSMRNDFKVLNINEPCNYYWEYMEGIEYRLIKNLNNLKVL